MRSQCGNNLPGANILGALSPTKLFWMLSILLKFSWRRRHSLIWVATLLTSSQASVMQSIIYSCRNFVRNLESLQSNTQHRNRMKSMFTWIYIVCPNITDDDSSIKSKRLINDNDYVLILIVFDFILLAWANFNWNGSRSFKSY